MPASPAARRVPHLPAVVLAAVAAVGSAAEPTAEDVAIEAAAAFEALDVSPRDGWLSGPELQTVADYDGDGDGRVSPEEFVRGYLVRKPAAAWRLHEFKPEGFACEMPGEPHALDAEGAARFQVAADLPTSGAIFIARSRDMPAGVAGRADSLFRMVDEQLEASGARVLGRQAADLGLHRGSVVAARREDGTLEVVRSVVVGRTVYELHAILHADAGAAGKHDADRFLGSLRLVR